MSGRLVEITNYPSPARIRDLMRDARQERAETVAELFGFGLSAMRGVPRSRRDRQGGVVELPATASNRS